MLDRTVGTCWAYATKYKISRKEENLWVTRFPQHWDPPVAVASQVLLAWYATIPLHVRLPLLTNPRRRSAPCNYYENNVKVNYVTYNNDDSIIDKQ